MGENDGIPEKNQLLFNLAVPLSGLKMVHRPLPPQAIHIEKVVGGHTMYTTHHPCKSHLHHNLNHHQRQQPQRHHHLQNGGSGDVVAGSPRQQPQPQQQQQKWPLLSDSMASEVFEQAMTLAKLDFKQQKRDHVSDSELPATATARNPSKSSDTRLLPKTTTASKTTMTAATTTTTTNNNSTTAAAMNTNNNNHINNYTAATYTRNNSSKWSQGVKVIESASSTTVKNASIQVSRRNPNYPCQSPRSPEPTSLSHLPATTNSPPTRDTTNPTQKKLQRILNDFTNCFSDLQNILNTFIKEGLNELVESELEGTGSNQDLTIVKVVSRKLYSIKQQTQELKRYLDSTHKVNKDRGLLTNKVKDMKYFVNRIASVLQGMLRLFLDMVRYLTKEPTYTLNPSMIFVCVIHVVHMLNVLSLITEVWSQVMVISGKDNSSAIDSLHQMIKDMKTLCSQFQCDSQHQPQLNIFNKPPQRPNFITQFSKPSDNIKTKKHKEINKMKPTPFKSIRAKGKASVKVGPRPLASKKSSVIYPAEVQHYRKAFPASSKHRPSVARRLPLHGPSGTHQSAVTKSYDYSKHARSVPVITSGKLDSFDNWHIHTMLDQLAAQSSSTAIAATTTGQDNHSGGGQTERPSQKKQQPHHPNHYNDEDPNLFLLFRQKYQPSRPQHRTGHATTSDGFDEDKTDVCSPNGAPSGPPTMELDPRRLRVHFNMEKKPVKNKYNGTTTTRPPPSSTKPQLEEEDTVSLLQTYLGDSSIQQMLHRLQQIEQEQLKIRQNWSTLVYPVTSQRKGQAPHNGVQGRAVSPILNTTEEPHQNVRSPEAITFTKEESHHGADWTKLVSTSSPFPSPRLHHPHITAGHYTNTAPSSPPDAPLTESRLFVQRHTLGAVKKNRAAYLLYLKNSAYHQVENFDPWDLTEKIADSILSDCVVDVLKEVQVLSDDIIQQIYENEFIAVPSSTDLQSQ